MSLLPSTQIILLPVVLLLTLPVAIFASLTTILAFSILSIRVTFVYIELALAIIPHYLFGPGPRPSSRPEYDLLKATLAPSSTFASSRRRKRRTSSSSNLSGTGTITPENLLGLSQSLGLTRDFEGVGGWRMDHDEGEEDPWMSLNSRLELPAEQGRRHHRRSLTSGSLPGDQRRRASNSPEAKVMNISKARTPPVDLGRNEDYFPSRRTLKSIVSITMGSSTKPVGGGNSGSSMGGSGLLMKQR